MIKVKNSPRLIICDTQAEADNFIPQEGDIVFVQGINQGPITLGANSAMSPKIKDEQTITFNNSKVGNYVFPVPFKQVPIVVPVLLDTSLAPAAKTAVTKTQVTIKFQTPYTGTLSLIINER